MPLYATFFLLAFNACGISLLALYKNGFEAEYLKAKSRHYKKFHSLYHRSTFSDSVIVTWVLFAVCGIAGIACALFYHFQLIV